MNVPHEKSEGGSIMRLNRSLAIVLATALCFAAVAASAADLYTAPSGDVNGNNTVDAQDIQCEVLIFTQVVLAGAVTEDQCGADPDCVAVYGDGFICRAGFTAHNICLPACISATVSLGESAAVSCTNPDADDADCLGLVQKRNADLNCDGDITNVDFTFLVAIVMSKLGGANTADYDSDQKLNFCDDDSDGDGDPDTTDCEDLDETISTLVDEICDNIDNNCSTLVDGEDPAIVADQMCELQNGVCSGVAKPGARCNAGSWDACTDADYLAANAAYEAVEVTCDGLDNDCDTFVDSLDPDIAACDCVTEADCPGYNTAPACDDTATCQGTKGVAACELGACLSNSEDDDSGCDAATVASDCGFYLDVNCTGEIDQSAPTCATSCAGDVECDADAHCDANVCVADQPDGGACDEDSDCADGFHCDDATGLCTADGGDGDGCSIDADCGDGFHCNEATGLCEADGGDGDGCTVDSDCADGFHCDTGLCVADGGDGDGCTIDADCGDGFHCNETTGLCEADGGDGDGCTVDSDCADGFHCDEATGLCVEDSGGGDGCTVDSDCADGYHCNEATGLCEADGGDGDGCTVDSDCATGYHCDTGTGLCVEDSGGGDGCTIDADCADGFHCNEATGLCEADGGDGDG